MAAPSPSCAIPPDRRQGLSASSGPGSPGHSPPEETCRPESQGRLGGLRWRLARQRPGVARITPDGHEDFRLAPSGKVFGCNPHDPHPKIGALLQGGFDDRRRSGAEMAKAKKPAPRKKTQKRARDPGEDAGPSFGKKVKKGGIADRQTGPPHMQGHPLDRGLVDQRVLAFGHSGARDEVHFPPEPACARPRPATPDPRAAIAATCNRRNPARWRAGFRDRSGGGRQSARSGGPNQRNGALIREDVRRPAADPGHAAAQFACGAGQQGGLDA